MLEVFLIQHTSISPNVILIVLRIQCNFHYVAMLMITSQLSISLDFAKTEKSRYLENEAQLFLHIKKFVNYT